MFKYLKKITRFKEKPSYHVEGSAYGGLRMDIDKFYAIEKNQEDLEKLNETFGQLIEKKAEQKEVTPEF